MGNEMELLLAEKIQDRTNCELECGEAMRHFEEGAQVPPEHTWDAYRVPTYLRLELEPRFLVGNVLYELPEKADREAMLKLLERVRTLMQAVPSAQATANVDAASVFAEVEGVEWSRSDVAKLTDALNKKFHLLQTLDLLSRDLQGMEWGLSRLQVKKEELTRRFTKATEDGNVAVSTEVLYDCLALHEDLLRMCDDKIRRLAEGLVKCTEERQSRLNEWKKGAALLEVLKESKVAKQDQCYSDLSKLQHGIEYEAQRAMDVQATFQQELLQNTAKLEALRQDTEATSQRMQQLVQQFMKEEVHLKELASQRAHVVQSRVTAVINEAQRVANFEEFLTLCKQHEASLQETLMLNRSAVEALSTVQLYLTGTNNFVEQDFGHTRHLLTESMSNAHRQLLQLHYDMFRDASDLQRRLEHTVADLDTELVRQEMLAEECRETLNPRAKQHVMDAQKLRAQKGEAEAQLSSVRVRIKKLDAQYFEKVRAKFAELGLPAVEHPRDMAEDLNLAVQERLLDHRSAMLEDGNDEVYRERDSLAQYSQQIGEVRAVRQANWQAMLSSADGESPPAWTSGSSERFPLSPSCAPPSVASVGFPIASPSQRLPARAEVRKVASYTAVRAPVEIIPTSASLAASYSGGGTSKRSDGPPAAALSVSSGRASPLDIARVRRSDPRTIGDRPSVPSVF
eukprot:GGOE01042927.1.p1 GENE.GGOE01042927.1~~GGOE01042927.1.p1  ORF type:complete len:739 (+),score=298.67 GGOE01042927.1:171-2219(+)